jgi:hypothetical protein
MNPEIKIRKSIHHWTLFFIVALVFSGVTAFALETELEWMNRILEDNHSSLSFWINHVHNALRETNRQYPFLAYGYDWLAFAHLAIAVVFFGVLKDPLKNKWVVQSGRIACCMIFPLAFIAGFARGIPFYWQLIDCSFGVLGLIPLTIVYHKIEKLETIVRPADPF